MLNKEKFCDEIICMVENECRIAVVDGKIVSCEDVVCQDCELQSIGNCSEN